MVAKNRSAAAADDQSSSIPMKMTNLRKVFVQRDYSQGTATRFNTHFPEDLEGRIDRHQFEQFINHLNEIYEEAERMTSRTCCESSIACLTAYFIYLCMDTYYDKCMKRAAAFIEDKNETLFRPRGVLVTDPLERGLRVIEITLFAQDPGGGQDPLSSSSSGGGGGGSQPSGGQTAPREDHSQRHNRPPPAQNNININNNNGGNRHYHHPSAQQQQHHPH